MPNKNTVSNKNSTLNDADALVNFYRNFELIFNNYFSLTCKECASFSSCGGMSKTLKYSCFLKCFPKYTKVSSGSSNECPVIAEPTIKNWLSKKGSVPIISTLMHLASFAKCSVGSLLEKNEFHRISKPLYDRFIGTYYLYKCDPRPDKKTIRYGIIRIIFNDSLLPNENSYRAFLNFDNLSNETISQYADRIQKMNTKTLETEFADKYTGNICVYPTAVFFHFNSTRDADNLTFAMENNSGIGFAHDGDYYNDSALPFLGGFAVTSSLTRNRIRSPFSFGLLLSRNNLNLTFNSIPEELQIPLNRNSLIYSFEENEVALRYILSQKTDT